MTRARRGRAARPADVTAEVDTGKRIQKFRLTSDALR